MTDPSSQYPHPLQRGAFGSLPGQTIASEAGHLPRPLGGELHDGIQTALVQAEAYQ
jgi:hypothetical protein